MSVGEDVFGAGIKLDRDMDMVVDGTGDIDYESGLAELRKDLAFRTKIELDSRLGQPLNETQSQILSVKATRIIQLDPRIQSVNETIVEQNSSNNEVTISVDVTANDGTTYEFVYPVSG